MFNKKAFCSKLMIVIFVFNIVFASVVCAGNIVKVYNFDESVRLQYEIESYNNKLYMSIYDLDAIELSCSEDDTCVNIYGNGTELIAYYESGLVFINDTKMYFDNAMITIDGMNYISVELIASVYSGKYEITNTQIRLWISSRKGNTVQGVISLPEGEAAPPGGVSVEVFAAVKKAVAGGGRVNIAYDGQPKPDYNTDINCSYIARDNIIIEEGKKQAEFFIVAEKGFGKSCFIGYKVNSSEYCEEHSEIYDKTNDMYIFTLSERKSFINGSVELPKITDEDVYFKVLVQDGKYVTSGKISAGEKTGSYSLPVQGGRNYCPKIVFDNGEYMREDYSELVYVDYQSSVANIDFKAQNAKKYPVTLICPNDIELSDEVQVGVTIQSADEPHYYLDSKTVILSSECKTATVDLYDDLNSDNVICYYYIGNQNDLLYDYGLYTENGTKCELKYADNVKSGISTEIELLKAESITTEISLPDDITPENDIVCSYDLFSTDGETYNKITLEDSSNIICILQCDRSATIRVKVPLYVSGCVLKLGDIAGDDRIYSNVYYKDNSSTVFINKATAIDENTDNIKIVKIKQNVISGNINGLNGAEISNPTVYAIYQSDTENIVDLHKSEMVFECEDYGANDRYIINLPDEINDFILCLRTAHMGIYYNPRMIAQKLSDAKLISVPADGLQFDFTYPGYNPQIPVIIDNAYQPEDLTNIVRVKLRNISDFQFNNSVMRMCLYDADDRLISVFSKELPILNANDGEVIDVKVTEEYSYIKVMLWDDKMKPLSRLFLLEEIVEDKEKREVVIKAGSEYITVDEKDFKMDVASIMKDGVLYASLWCISEVFCADVYFYNDTDTIEIKLNGHTLKMQVRSSSMIYDGKVSVNGDEPIISEGVVMVSPLLIAKIFDLKAKFDNIHETLTIYS